MTAADLQPRPSAIRRASRLDGLRPYRAQPHTPSIDLRLDANEGAPPADAVLEALRSIGPDELRRYPDASPLEQRIGARFGIDASRVVATNGGDDAIDRVCRAVLEPGREMLTHAPSFVMIPRSARLAGGAVRAVPWVEGAFPARAIQDAISDRTSLIALVTPNNPTGGVITADALLTIARAAARVGSLVMVDLAYVEFADHDPCPALLDEPNVVVIRTLSKSFGLAGARVGYAIAPTLVAEWLRTAGGPYPVSSLSLALAARALEDEDGRAAFISDIRRERADLSALLGELGCLPAASQANFLLAQFPDAAFVHRSLASMGVLVRAFDSTPGLENALRITLPGSAPEFHRLCDAFRTVLASASPS